MGSVFLAIEANFTNMKNAQLRPLKITLSTKSMINKKLIVPLSFSHENRNYQANIFTHNLALSFSGDAQKDLIKYLVSVDYILKKIIEAKFTTIQSLLGSSEGKLQRWSIPFSGVNKYFFDPEIIF